MFKKLSFKILLLLIVLVLSNIVYSRWFYEKDIQDHSELINLVRNIPDSADIIYIGESSNITVRGDDTDKRGISHFIGDFYPGLNTYDITKPASHAGIFKVLMENIPEENKVKTFIVTLNLRSFNAQWIYSELETPLQKSMVLIKPYPPLLNRFLLSFKAYDIKTDKERMEEVKAKWKRDEFDLDYDFQFKNVIEWDNWMANRGIADEKGNYDDPKTQQACHYIKTYGFQLDTLKNPRIHDFDDIIKLAQKRGWNLVFNLLAENTEEATELVGGDLINMINENTRILEDYYSRRGVLVVNNLNEVEDEQFIDRNWTTEHYAEKGRKVIAANVAQALKIWHGDHFKEVNYKEYFITRFFSDCENDTDWPQKHTITTGMAYSGNSSSAVGEGNDFSITLEYPLKVIPDSIKNTIRIEFWLFQKSLNHDAQLVVQANGKEIQDLWNGFSLKEFSKQTNTWTKYIRNFPIPESIKKADLIKIYVYNPSGEKVYIDDLDIRIK